MTRERERESFFFGEERRDEREPIF